MGAKIHDIGFDSDFLDTTPNEQATKETLDTLELIKMKHFCAQRTLITQ